VCVFVCLFVCVCVSSIKSNWFKCAVRLYIFLLAEEKAS
jgi:Ca2+/H+ antiporter